MPFPPDLRREVRAQEGYACAFCGRQTRTVEVHHQVPSRDGGSDAIENAEALCPACHDMLDGEQERGLTYGQARQKLSAYADYLHDDKG